MRKRIVVSADDVLSDLTCEDYSVVQAAGGGLAFIRLKGGLDEDGDVVEELIFSGMPFIVSVLVPSEGVTVTIPLAEYESLQETCAILSDKQLVAELKQADVAAGDLTDGGDFGSTKI